MLTAWRNMCKNMCNQYSLSLFVHHQTKEFGSFFSTKYIIEKKYQTIQITFGIKMSMKTILSRSLFIFFKEFCFRLFYIYVRCTGINALKFIVCLKVVVLHVDLTLSISLRSVFSYLKKKNVFYTHWKKSYGVDKKEVNITWLDACWFAIQM